MNERDAIAALVSDLHWQIDQPRPRGIKDNAGNPYNPSYYKRGLQNAIDRGGVAVADYHTALRTSRRATATRSLRRRTR